MTTTPKQPTDEELAELGESLSKEEIAWLMKIDWKSLQAPKWTFQNKKDLEKLGEALFSGKELKDLDNATLDRIFPHLIKVAKCLGALIKLGMPQKHVEASAGDDRVIPITKNNSPATEQSPEKPSPAPRDTQEGG